MIIAVTGTPGTGKTSLSKKLSNTLSYRYVDLNKLVDEEDLVTGTDLERGSKIVDTDKFGKLELNGNCVVDGHLSHYLDADLVVVLRTRPDKLKERLEKRNWSAEKIYENVEAEIIGVCSSEAHENFEHVLELDTSETDSDGVAKSIKSILDKNKNVGQIDWLEDYGYMLKK